MTKDFNIAVKEASELPHYKCVDLLAAASEGPFKDFIESDTIIKLLTSNEHFDLVITEALSGQEFELIVGHVFKAPVISLQPYFTNYVANNIFGNTLSIAHIPNPCSPFSNKMSFYERILNTLHVLRNLYYIYYNNYIPSTEQKLKKYFPDAPPLLDMINNISLIFVNDHLTADYPQPRTPNIIPVAGIHIEEETPLPKAIQNFMDGATNGVIFFSLGTYVPDELQPQEYFDMYNNVFRQLKQRVLWKTRKENIQGLPDNVMTVKWAPQRDVLAHPKSVLFITHGGMLSLHETVYCGVPVVAIPQFYDQHRNGKFYEEKGIGVRLSKDELIESKVLSAIRTVLNNPQYTINVKSLSRIFKDRPMTPAQTVVYWTEYILKHGASHLKPASTQLAWYQLALLDVLAVIILFLTTVAIATYLISIRIMNFLCYERKHNLRIKEKCN